MDAEEFCPLRQQQAVPRGRVKDVLGDLGNDVAGQIGIGARHHDAQDHRAGFDFKLLPDHSGIRGNPACIFPGPVKEGFRLEIR